MTPAPTDVRRANAATADAIVAALRDCGVQHAFVSPGSRSTPLVFALVRNGLPSTVVLDERTAGFAAIGAARVGVRAVVITTSGTAVGNLVPAAIEAMADELTPVFLTADRPRCAVHRGANQTIDQPPVLAGVVARSLDVGAPYFDVSWDNETSPPHLKGSIADCLALPALGPAHINVRFEKPLEPETAPMSSTRPATTISEVSAPLIGGHVVDDASFIDVAARGPDGSPDSPPSTESNVDADTSVLGRARRGLVIVASLPHQQRRAGREVVRAMLSRGWPVVIDNLSGLSRRSFNDPAVATPTSISHMSADADGAPDVVLWIGDRVTEDRLPHWIKRTGAHVIQWRNASGVRDPHDVMHAASVVTTTKAAEVLADLPLHGSELRDAVVRVSTTIAPIVDEILAETLSEPMVARVTAAHAAGPFVVASSMPIRDLDRFSSLDDASLLVCSRGASGIDGTFSTALGVAMVLKRPVTILVGDLAALHDLSGLLALQHSGVVANIVVVNNRGGGIFSLLPIAHEAPDVFEKFFETPHAFSVAQIGSSMGIACQVVTHVDQLARGLSSSDGVRLFEILTERTSNAALHAAIDDAIDDAVGREHKTSRLHTLPHVRIDDDESRTHLASWSAPSTHSERTRDD